MLFLVEGSVVTAILFKEIAILLQSVTVTSFAPEGLVPELMVIV